ncbi:hypothetical protein DV736_g1684, partial [Chaetothyriales sp. CBS 134916]
MDYLARLIAGGRPSPKHNLNTPAERLETTVKVCNNLRFLWQKGNVDTEDEGATVRIAELLDRLNKLLVEESRKAVPHSCLSHIATSQIYIIVTKLALQSQDNDVTQVSSQLFHLLIDGDAEGLLDNKLFSRSLIDLVRYTLLALRVVVDDPTKSSLIELLFSVCSKIRLDPSILPAWFHPERERSQGRALQGESRRSQFPLFYVLVQFVHHDGAVGDFARTGLLYLTETAARSKSLETWMIESDLAPQMASGLGALYSSLSRHFPSLEDAEKSLPILSLSDLPHGEDGLAETRASFQENMKEFLAYLAFWQDTLNHCQSAEVSDTLMDHFQVLFVQQLLYPSLLESSDVDGGSTSAVIAHLTRILLALDHQELSRRLLGYLLASKTAGSQDEPRKHRPRLSMSRRKSMDHLAALAEAAQSPSPDLFNLSDLLLISLKSEHVDTVNGSLKLIGVIINKHHQYVLTGLFRTEPITGAISPPTVETITNTLMEYFEIAASVSWVESTMDQSYQSALADIKGRLHNHSCLGAICGEDDDGALMLSIVPGCKLSESILNLLSSFFGNTTLTNLLLTETIVSLASCDRIALHGWLMPALGKEDKRRQNVTSVLRKLAQQADEWRSKFQDWESLTARRRSDLSKVEDEVKPDSRSLVGQTAISQQGIDTPAQQSSRPITPSRRSIGSPAFGSIDETLVAFTGHRIDTVPSPLAGSPLRRSYIPLDPSQDAIVQEALGTASISHLEELLNTQVQLRAEKEPGEYSQSASLLTPSTQAGRQASTEDRKTGVVDKTGSGAVTPNLKEAGAVVTRNQASLNHILTNAIILQEFILEIAAVIQARGIMFGEVDLR